MTKKRRRATDAQRAAKREEAHDKKLAGRVPYLADTAGLLAGNPFMPLLVLFDELTGDAGHVRGCDPGGGDGSSGGLPEERGLSLDPRLVRLTCSMRTQARREYLRYKQRHLDLMDPGWRTGQ